MVPWWHSKFMVKGGTYEDVAEAMLKAPEMGTEERIEKFASQKLIDILEIGFAEGKGILEFQTEFECMFVDETEAYFPYELLVACRTNDKPWQKWPNLYQSEYPLTMGVDLASKRDSTVITVVEHGPKKKLIYFQEISAGEQTYPEQFDTIKKLIKTIRPARISIDETGAGQYFGERARHGELETSGAVETINFTNDMKERWATTFKGDLQTDKVEYPNHQKFFAQTHGIKRKRTETGRFKFAGDPDDFFWSAMLALYGEERVPVRFTSLGR